jgi:hypothetical protein
MRKISTKKAIFIGIPVLIVLLLLKGVCVDLYTMHKIGTKEFVRQAQMQKVEVSKAPVKQVETPKVTTISQRDKDTVKMYQMFTISIDARMDGLNQNERKSLIRTQYEVMVNIRTSIGQMENKELKNKTMTEFTKFGNAVSAIDAGLNIDSNIQLIKSIAKTYQ